MSDLEAALQQFEATESSLKKLELLWAKIESLIEGHGKLDNITSHDTSLSTRADASMGSDGTRE